MIERKGEKERKIERERERWGEESVCVCACLCQCVCMHVNKFLHILLEAFYQIKHNGLYFHKDSPAKR